MRRKITLRILLTMLVILLALSLAGCGSKPETSTPDADPAPPTTTTPDDSKTPPKENDKHDIVLPEKESEQIGNILSNQFYFESEDKIFYSCSDQHNSEHIYMKDKKDGSLNIIFDGFGWNLVERGDWLYFSGNAGTRLDGTYNIFRVKTDGSEYENLNDKYSYGLFFFGDDLYYLQQDEDYSTSYHLYSLNPETKEKKELRRFSRNAIPYQGRIYLADNSGNVLSYAPEMKDPKVLLQADAKSFIINQDKLIYIDHNNNIKILDLNSKDIKVIRNSVSAVDIVFSINAHDKKLFFTEYNSESFNFDIYAYQCNIKSMDLDGSNETEIHDYYTITPHINIVNSRILAFEQRRSQTQSDAYALSIISLSLDGQDVYTLQN